MYDELIYHKDKKPINSLNNYSKIGEGLIMNLVL